MTFIHPAENETFYAGRSYDILMNTFGLSSRWHGKTVDMYLLDENYVRVTPKPILTDKEFKVLDVNQTLLRSLNGIGHMKWTIPSDLPSGRYYLKYVSGWTLWRNQAKFSKVSKGFFIVNPNRNYIKKKTTKELIPVLLRNGSTILVPKELSFRYPYSSGWKNVTIQSLKGTQEMMIDMYNGAVSSIKAPRKALSQLGSVLRHPIQSWNTMMEKWDEEHDSNPYKAWGKVMAISTLLSLPQLLMSLKGGRAFTNPCTGGACGHGHGHSHGPNAHSQHDHPSKCHGGSCHGHDH